MMAWMHWMEIMEPGELMYIAEQTGLDQDLLNALLWQRCADIQGGPAYQADAPDGTITIWFDGNASSGLAGATYDREERKSRMNQRVKQAPLPPEERIAAMATIMVESRRAHEDVGELIAAALHAAAEKLGGADALVSGRPGSWEADIMLRMANEGGSGNQTRTRRLAALFVQMGKAGEDGGDVLSQAMGQAVNTLGGLAEFGADSCWRADLMNIGRQYSNYWDSNVW
jgi:hypothetical protein